MALHLVLFRLKSDQTYLDRYQSLVDAVKALAPSRWEEATAAYLLWFDGAPGQLLQKLVLGSKVYRNGDDMVVVVDMATRKHAFIGVKETGKLDLLLALGRTTTAEGPRVLGATLPPRVPTSLGSR